jgi:hypothetical protein
LFDHTSTQQEHTTFSDVSLFTDFTINANLTISNVTTSSSSKTQPFIQGSVIGKPITIIKRILKITCVPLKRTSIRFLERGFRPKLFEIFRFFDGLNDFKGKFLKFKRLIRQNFHVEVIYP